ncbi:MAG: arylamine N-acetyltransferase [Rhizobacter sp.]
MIDLASYLQRIGYVGPREASHAVLDAICALQPASIVYENIDPLLGSPPLLSLPAVEDKLVAQRRGGYCFEQNVLLNAALAAMGMQVSSLVARVVWMRPPDAPTRARNHMLLRVDIGNDSFIADAGFGGHMLNTPLKLVPALVQRTPHAVLRITQDGELYSVETQLPDGWVPMYRFTLEPQRAVDYEPLNWFTATHPSSIFCHNLLMERLMPDSRINLFNDRLIVRHPGGMPRVRRIDRQADFGQVIAEQFGLDLHQALIASLYERIPKGLDQFVMPTA